jgi:hypothetical protein
MDILNSLKEEIKRLAAEDTINIHKLNEYIRTKQGMTKEEVELDIKRNREIKEEKERRKSLNVIDKINNRLSAIECMVCHSIIEANISDLEMYIEPSGCVCIKLSCPNCKYELSVSLYSGTDEQDNIDIREELYKLGREQESLHRKERYK